MVGDPLSRDIGLIIRIRNQIIHADGDDIGLGTEARGLLASYHALNAGADEIQCNSEFCRFAWRQVDEYILRVGRALSIEITY